jgi:type I restriction enzyme M protein
MAIKKSELYSSLWQSADELRGGMDASQYQDYVLVLLFVKYVSDKYAGQPDALIEVPEGGGFKDIVAAKGNKDIGDGINKIIAWLDNPTRYQAHRLLRRGNAASARIGSPPML